MNMRGKRKIERKILAFLLSVCMLFTAQPNLWDGVMVQAAEKVENDTDSGIMIADDGGQHADHTGWTALKTDNENATQLSSGNYYLEKSVNMGTITIAENANVTLCLNGKTLKHIGESGSVIVVGEGAKFTLCDCQEEYSYDKSNDLEGNPVYTFENSGGCITKGNSEHGGGIYISQNAIFNMESGVIRDNKVDEESNTNGGGGVYLESNSTFNMSGGAIAENRGYQAAVYIGESSTFKMSGNALIIKNFASINTAVWCSKGGVFEMIGASCIIQI